MTSNVGRLNCVLFKPFKFSSRNLHADVELTTVRALYGKEKHMYVALVSDSGWSELQLKTDGGRPGSVVSEMNAIVYLVFRQKCVYLQTNLSTTQLVSEFIRTCKVSI
jgi:hypothetical protein